MEKMLKELRSRGYQVFTRPFELNIIGVRSELGVQDEMHIFYKLPNGQWNYHVFALTTDSGALDDNLSIPILKEGQYLNAYAYSEKDRALIQVKEVTVIKNYHRGSAVQWLNGEEERGLFNINILHR